jgi:hypothetical protein
MAQVKWGPQAPNWPCANERFHGGDEEESWIARNEESALVSIRVGHELIRTGPYARTRHPIDIGILLWLGDGAGVRGIPGAGSGGDRDGCVCGERKERGNVFGGRNRGGIRGAQAEDRVFSSSKCVIQ